MSRFVWQIRDRRLEFDRPLVMGILNVTPDSFSDGGRHFTLDAAVQHGLQLIEEGADILDVGGESTRPGAEPVPLDEELRRVVPVIQALAAQINVPISVDTSKPEVARQSLGAGAHIVNDVTALREPAMIQLIGETQAGAVLMHMQGTPATMQIAPHYDDVVAEVERFFEHRLAELTSAGIAAEQLVIDPGIGFGKTFEHTLAQLRALPDLQRLGRPVCLGVSRKGFIGQITRRPRQERVAGSLAVLCHGLAQGAVQIARVHDVAATVDAMRILAALGNVKVHHH